MAKNTYSFDKGFLLNYAQQVPILEDFEREKDYASIGLLIMNAIRRQRDGVPFPSVDNPALHTAMLAFEHIIQNGDTKVGE